ncbi:MAG TPA: CHASE3 domain-containing protein [Solirubrobacterales bacterium]
MRRLLSQLGVRLAAASGVLAVIIGATFGLLLVAIEDVRKTSRLTDDSRLALTASDGLGELVLDLETGSRGFVITGQERFLVPWKLALARFPAQARMLERLADGPEQSTRARLIVAEARSYIRDYSIPLVGAVRRRSHAASSVAVTAAGTRRVDRIRTRLAGFAAAEGAKLDARQDQSDADVRRAITLGIVGLVGSFGLIAAFAAYLLRSVARPVRRTATMAGRLADGDFAARLPERGAGEIGDLERSFNMMAGSLGRSRDDLDRLLLEQGALRRVATLVAEGAEPARIFEIVTRELGRLSGADLARLERYESDAAVTAIAAWSRDQAPELATGRRFELIGPSIAARVLERLGPARVDSFVGADGAIAEEARSLGIRSSVGCPVLVEGRLWGVIAASSRREAAFPPETESQIGEFTDLVATAVANAEARDELIASRARIVAAADEARRRIRRDLHDGGQQRLVHALITLKLARRSLGDSEAKTEALIDEALEHTEGAVEALRELSHGILPSVLTRGGLRAGVGAVVARMPLLVEVDIDDERFPPGIEATAYFVVSEALTNVVKHSGATRAEVVARAGEGALRVEVRDDGVGGARLGAGSGLVGLRDRVDALAGTLEIESHAGAGTRIALTLPLPGPSDAAR